MDSEEVVKRFKGKLVGNKRMRYHVAEVLSKLPDTIVIYITQYCWFMASMDDAWAFTFTGDDLIDQHLIFLSDELLSQTHEQIHYTIAHEIGHVILGHRNSVLIKQTKKEVGKQEKEAHDFAIQYFPTP